MSIADPLPESVDEIGDPNLQARRGQNLRWLLIIGFASLIGGLIFYMMNFKAPSGAAQQQKALRQRSLATANVAAPAAISPEAENTRLRGQMTDMQQQMQAIMDQNAQLSAQNDSYNQNINGYSNSTPQVEVPRTRPVEPYETNGSYSKAPGDAASHPPPSAASPLFMDKVDGGEGAQAVMAASGPQGTPRRAIRLVGAVSGSETPSALPEATGASSGATLEAKDKAKDEERLTLVDTDAYVAPNAYVKAKVLVGVDMQTGISATTDPKPVLFRIEGRAIGVGANGKFQTSDLNGCLVNGAAFAELSSEKVYIKLQKITCAAGNNQTLVSKVDGYVTYKGKAGVRGRVVSREGNFASKAMVAGTLQGLGQAMSTNVQRAQSSLSATGSGASLSTAPLTGAQIAQDMIGSGVGSASSMLADYYIKRAEQYQPVIEMPTGMHVELVFLDGFRFTTKTGLK
jgi:conjugal transfer pilus assembly protein TraB